MATINLGAIKFNWKGAYNSSTSYAVDDVVSSGGNSYVCIQAHSNQAVGNATAYWNIMSSAGTNGTNGTDETNGNGNGVGNFSQDSDQNIRFTGNDIDSIQNEPSTLTMEIFNPYQNDVHTQVKYYYGIRASNNYYYGIYGMSHIQQNASLRNMIFKQAGGANFAGYKATIYGVKR